MTTAATIWVTAAAGVAAGSGHPVAAIALGLLVRTVLATVQGWEIRHLGGMCEIAIHLVVDPEHGKTKVRIERLRGEFHVTTQRMRQRALRSEATAASPSGNAELPRRPSRSEGNPHLDDRSQSMKPFR